MDNEITVTVSGGGSYSSSDTAFAIECFWDPFLAADVVKTATDGNGNVISTAAYGDFILYVYTVTNTGDGTFNTVSLIDDNGTPGDPFDDITAFCDTSGDVLPGGSFQCDAEREVTAEDVAAGSITNIADLYVFEDDYLASSNPVTVTITQNPSLSMTKTATDGDGGDVETAELDDIITYVYRVENDGDVPLSGVRVDDDVIGEVVDCFIEGDQSFGAAGGPVGFTLFPGDILVCVAEHEVDSDNVAAGEIVNTATATGQPPAGDPVDTSATETVDVINHPALSVIKSAEPDADVEVGETLHDRELG
jgi:hypothetical protein